MTPAVNAIDPGTGRKAPHPAAVNPAQALPSI